MSLPLALLLQVSAAPPADVIPSDFDLKKVATSDEAPPAFDIRCAAADPDEIVVCGRKGRDYRYRVLRDQFPPDIALPRAELDLGGGASAGVTLDPVIFSSGLVSKRVMVTLKKKF